MKKFRRTWRSSMTRGLILWPFRRNNESALNDFPNACLKSFGKSHLRSLASLTFLFLAISCSGPGSSNNSPPATPTPRSLKSILNDDHPIQFYIDTYASFRFSSHSRLLLG